MRDEFVEKRKEWFARAAAPAKEGEKPCVMVLDFDDTTAVGTSPDRVESRLDRDRYQIPSKFSELYPHQMVFISSQQRIEFFRLFVDLVAIKEIRDFQERGHILFLATAGSYHYSQFWLFFSHFGIALSETHFVNRAILEKADSTGNTETFGKGHYLANSSNPALRDGFCMLFDDNRDNNPEKVNGRKNDCYFAWVSRETSFPRLSVPAAYEVSLVGAYQRHYQNPKNWPQMFKQVPAGEKKSELIQVPSALVPA